LGFPPWQITAVEIIPGKNFSGKFQEISFFYIIFQKNILSLQSKNKNKIRK